MAFFPSRKDIDTSFAFAVPAPPVKSQPRKKEGYGGMDSLFAAVSLLSMPSAQPSPMPPMAFPAGSAMQLSGDTAERAQDLAKKQLSMAPQKLLAKPAHDKDLVFERETERKLAVSAYNPKKEILQDDEQVLKKYHLQKNGKAFVQNGKDLEYSSLNRVEIINAMQNARNLLETDRKEAESQGIVYDLDNKTYLMKFQQKILHVYLISAKQQLGAAGSTGTAYKVLNVSAGIFEAIKLAHASKQARESIKAEYEMLIEANKAGEHTNLQQKPTIDFEFQLEDEEWYGMTGPLYQGNLSEWIQRKRSMTERIKCCQQLMQGAYELWEKRKIQHFDLKPGNIFVDSVFGRTVFRIADFGSAFSRGTMRCPPWTCGYYQESERSALRKILEGTMAERDAAAVTKAQAKFVKQAAAVDLFALGTVFYQVVTGEPKAFPYPKQIMRSLGIELINELAPFDARGTLKQAEVPPAIINLVEQMVQHKPENRISVEAAMRAWQAI
jgi:hypothetical protein